MSMKNNTSLFTEFEVLCRVMGVMASGKCVACHNGLNFLRSDCFRKNGEVEVHYSRPKNNFVSY